MKFTIVTDPRAEKELKEAYYGMKKSIGFGQSFCSSCRKGTEPYSYQPRNVSQKERELQNATIIYEVFKKDSTLLLL